jgi:hypothetical protein
MLSSGSDASPEASPTRTDPSKEDGKGEKQANSNNAGDRNGATQNKGKTPASTRRKKLTTEKGRTDLQFYSSALIHIRSVFHCCLLILLTNMRKGQVQMKGKITLLDVWYVLLYFVFPASVYP